MMGEWEGLLATANARRSGALTRPEQTRQGKCDPRHMVGHRVEKGQHHQDTQFQPSAGWRFRVVNPKVVGVTTNYWKPAAVKVSTWLPGLVARNQPTRPA